MKAKETIKSISISLNQPLWDAWKKYSWQKGVEGIGIEKAIIQRATLLRKNIIVNLPIGKFRISGHRAQFLADMYGSHYKTKDNRILLILPRSAFFTLKKKTPETPTERLPSIVEVLSKLPKDKLDQIRKIVTN